MIIIFYLFNKDYIKIFCKELYSIDFYNGYKKVILFLIPWIHLKLKDSWLQITNI